MKKIKLAAAVLLLCSPLAAMADPIALVANALFLTGIGDVIGFAAVNFLAGAIVFGTSAKHSAYEKLPEQEDAQ